MSRTTKTNPEVPQQESVELTGTPVTEKEDELALREQKLAQMEAELKKAQEKAAKELAEKEAKLAALEKELEAKRSAPEPEEEAPTALTYEELPSNATVLFEINDNASHTVNRAVELTKKRTIKSMTKQGWEGLPKQETGSQAGQPKHMDDAKLVGYVNEKGDQVFWLN